MYNTLWLNPAYAGTRDALTVTGIYRSQWVGFEGAPQDQSVTIHSPIFKGKMGLGLSLLNDKIGPTQSTILALDFQYQIKLGPKSKLGFGLKGLVNFFKNNLSTLNIDTENDAVFAKNNQVLLPNSGAGIYYYSERFYVGLSSPKLLENTSTGRLVLKEKRHYFLIMGTVLKLSHTVKLKPTIFIKATEGSPIEGDLTGTFIFKDKVNLGVMYRTGDAVGALIGYSISEKLSLGYSFDFSTTNTTGKYNNGSHEIMIRYDLISQSKAKIKSPRYF
jgi:type IX secretion system PorP/SprF family membrane protein